MKEGRKKSKTATVDDGDESLENIINEFTDIVVEGFKEGQRNGLESFDQYTARIQAKMHANMDEFRKRFVKGYQVLLEEIEKEVKLSDHPPQPGSIKP